MCLPVVSLLLVVAQTTSGKSNDRVWTASSIPGILPETDDLHLESRLTCCHLCITSASCSGFFHNGRQCGLNVGASKVKYVHKQTPSVEYWTPQGQVKKTLRSIVAQTVQPNKRFYRFNFDTRKWTLDATSTKKDGVLDAVQFAHDPSSGLLYWTSSGPVFTANADTLKDIGVYYRPRKGSKVNVYGIAIDAVEERVFLAGNYLVEDKKTQIVWGNLAPSVSNVTSVLTRPFTYSSKFGLSTSMALDRDRKYIYVTTTMGHIWSCDYDGKKYRVVTGRLNSQQLIYNTDMKTLFAQGPYVINTITSRNRVQIFWRNYGRIMGMIGTEDGAWIFGKDGSSKMVLWNRSSKSYPKPYYNVKTGIVV